MRKVLVGLVVVVCFLAGCSSSSKTGTAVVPSVLGIRACDALPMLTGAGLVPEVTPASEILWIVSAQTPAAGEHVDRGATAVLTLMVPPAGTQPPLSASCKGAKETQHRLGVPLATQPPNHDSQATPTTAEQPVTTLAFPSNSPQGPTGTRGPG